MARIIRTETRVRSGWNKLWIALLVIFNLLMAWEALSLSQRASQLQKSTSGLGHLAVSIVAGQRMNEVLMLWVGGTLLLGILVWVTRPTAVIIETAEAAEARRTEISWTTFAARLLGAVALLVWFAASARIADVLVVPRSEAYAAIVVGLWAAGFLAFAWLVRATRASPRKRERPQ